MLLLVLISLRKLQGFRNSVPGIVGRDQYIFFYYFTPLYIPTKKPISRKLTTSNAGEDMEQQELSITAVVNAKWCSHFEDSLVASYKIKHILTI